MENNYKKNIIILLAISVILGLLAILLSFNGLLFEATCFAIAFMLINLAILTKLE